MAASTRQVRLAIAATIILRFTAPTATSQTATQQSTQQTADLPAVFTGFQASGIKFPLRSLMNLLRDRNHEGWVLAPYPDPNTGHPLIGAGFSLDLPATDHPQRDPLNPHPFLEPSSAQLWQAAGLDPERLQRILDKFAHDRDTWSSRLYRRKVATHTLPPILSEEEATRLLRISAIQAAENARAYCRCFDQLNASQQMALSQLVFQMGVNLEQFVDFLSALNGDDQLVHFLETGVSLQTPTTEEHWQTIQAALIDSQWARRYTRRAATVIAMFDPNYALAPGAKQQQLEDTLRPPPRPRHKGQTTASLQAANHPTRSRHGSKPAARRHSRIRA